MSSGDIYKLSVIFTLGGGQQAVTTLHYAQDGATTLPGARACAEGWNTAFMTGLRNLLSTTYLVQRLEARQQTPPKTEGFDLAVGLGGTAAGETVPPMDAALVSWRTGLVGRRYRGRAYWPAPTETMQSAGTLLPATVTSWGTLATDMISFVATDGSAAVFNLVIFHRDLGTGTPVTSAIPQALIATQRRRRAGVGS